MLFPTPAAAVSCDSAENDELYFTRLASDEGLELLRCNWDFLLLLLFPSLGDSAREEEEEEATPTPERDEGEDEVEAPPPEGPITLQSLREYYGHASAAEVERAVARMRHPDTMDRVHYSYIVFLRFMGWKIHSDERGELDRHRNWKERYDVLARCGAASPSSSDVGGPRYESFNFYTSCVPRIVKSFLSLGFLTYAARFVEFFIDEAACGRLQQCVPWVEQEWLPLLEGCPELDPHHTKRIRHKIFKLTHSDSD